MLNHKNRLGKSRFYLTAFLLFFSCITLQSKTFAVDQKQIAEEYRARGYAAHQKGNLHDALSFYSKAISLGLENAIIFNDIGVLYEQLGIPSKAEQFYLKSITLDQEYLPSYANLAYFYQRIGKLDKAVEYFKLRYEKAKPGDVWADKAKDELVNIDPELRHWVVAIEADRLNKEMVDKVHQDLVNRISRSAEHHRKGVALHEAGQFQLAMIEFDQALKLTPDNPKIIKARKKSLVEVSKRNVQGHYDQAMSLLESGDSLGAQTEIRKILASISDGQNEMSLRQEPLANNWDIPNQQTVYNDLIRTSVEFYQKGQRKLKGGDFQGAVKEFNRALKLTPQNPKVINALEEAKLQLAKNNILHHSQQALNMLEVGDKTSAESEIQKMLTEIAKENRLALKKEQELDKRWVAEANVDFDDYISRSKEHFDKGQSLFEEEKYDEAMIEFNHALRFTPNDHKIKDARERTELELTKRRIKQHSDQAIKMLDSGDSYSAKSEIHKILTSIPNESETISK